MFQDSFGTGLLEETCRHIHHIHGKPVASFSCPSIDLDFLFLASRWFSGFLRLQVVSRPDISISFQQDCKKVVGRHGEIPELVRWNIWRKPIVPSLTQDPRPHTKMLPNESMKVKNQVLLGLWTCRGTPEILKTLNLSVRVYSTLLSHPSSGGHGSRSVEVQV